MTENANSDEKLKNPATHFADPHEVVIDSSLSSHQKTNVLDTLEQDARQLAQASSEGMAGGERNKLHDVLAAKDELILAPRINAYEIVLHDLQTWRSQEPDDTTRVEIERAIAALDKLVVALAAPDIDKGAEEEVKL